MRLLAFYAPYPGAGKTLAAKWVARRFGMHTRAFAVPLRNAVHDIIYFPDDLSIPVSPDDKEAIIPHLGVSWREIMITFGNAGRALTPDFWVRLMARQMDMYPFDYVVDDLRFQNEYDFLRARGAKIIRIENPGRVIVTTSTEGRLEGNRFDAVIANTKENLRAYLRDVEEAARYVLQGRDGRDERAKGA